MNEDMKLILDEIKGIRQEMMAMDECMKKLEERIIKLDAKVDAHRADTVSGFAMVTKALGVILEKINGMENITGRNMYDIAILKLKQA